MRRALAAASGLSVEVEVETLEELDEALAAGAHVGAARQLQHLRHPPRRRADCRAGARSRSPAASRSIGWRSWPPPAPTSSRSGALTHSAPAVDLSFEIDAAGGLILPCCRPSRCPPRSPTPSTRPGRGSAATSPTCAYAASVPSTMDWAAALADAGGPHGLVVVAGHQTAGRGRRGRRWHSPADAGLYFSTVVRPPIERVADGEPSVFGLLTLAAGVAVAEGDRPGDRARGVAQVAQRSRSTATSWPACWPKATASARRRSSSWSGSASTCAT